MNILRLFTEKMQRYTPSVKETRIEDAFNLAKEKCTHKIFGKEYWRVVLDLLNIVIYLKPDENTIIAIILHDILYKYPEMEFDIRQKFGPDVVYLIKNFDKLRNLCLTSQDEKNVDNLRKLFLVIASDLRVVIMKLIYRLFRIRYISFYNEEEKKTLLQESLLVYAPIASRFGIYYLKKELEDLSFKYLNPFQYKNIASQVEMKMNVSKTNIEEMKTSLINILEENHINAQVCGRTKNFYAIYSKLKRKGQSSINDIFDFFALRIILQDQEKNGDEFFGHCYEVLSLVNSRFNPAPDRFKDYIQAPKLNGYRSLHTTVTGLTAGKELTTPVEIQIRTQRMDDQATYGIAAHWFYSFSKSFSTNIEFDDLEKFNEKNLSSTELTSLVPKFLINESIYNQIQWIKNLRKLQTKLSHSSAPLRKFSIDIFDDRVFVLTSSGEIIDLPKDSTPVDFAYAIDSNIGNRCITASVDGHLVPLDYRLNNGEMVTILLKPQDEPNRYWLSFVKTDKAKKEITDWYSKFDREKNIKLGKILLEKFLKSKKSIISNKDFWNNFEEKKGFLQDKQDVLEKLGNGMLNLDEAISALSYDRSFKGLSHKSKFVMMKSPKWPDPGLIDYIVVFGERGMPLKLAACCKPLFNVPIVGYTTRGRGITVHRINCLVVSNLEKERLIELIWDK